MKAKRFLFVVAAMPLLVQGAVEDVAKGEFQKYWRQIADNEPPRVEMRVDATLAGPQGEDAYRVRERDGALVFSGANARSCLYAVYAFFESLGCAWFWDGDRLPPRRARRDGRRP